MNKPTDGNGPQEADIAALRRTLHELWLKACAADNIPPESAEVEFSRENPYRLPYLRAVVALMDARKKLGYYRTRRRK